MPAGPKDSNERTNPFAESYGKLYFPPPPEDFGKIENSLRDNHKWGINVTELEGRLLRTLVQLHRPEKLVEIGTLFGYSTRWFLEGIKSYLNTVAERPHLWSLEKSVDHHAKAKAYLQPFVDENLLTLIQGDALETLPVLSQSGPFDLVFIDANKKHYPFYLTWAAQNLRQGGVLIADNIYLFGRIFEKTTDLDPMREAMVDFNERFWRENFFDCSLIPTQEGLVLGIKK